MSGKNHYTNGIAELLILSILEAQDSYGYEITRKIETASGGLLSISQNTIYAAIYKLENEEKISEYSKVVGKKRTRVYYHIEEKGLEYLESLKSDYFKTTQGVQAVLEYLSE